MCDTIDSVQVKKLSNALIDLPDYATTHSSGIDLFAAIIDPIVLEHGEIKIIPTGIAISLPVGYEGQIRSRSGLAANYGITVLNSPGTIDSDYRGEIKVILINHGDYFKIERGMRIAQMVISKYTKILKWDEIVYQFSDITVRNDNGFGSTGII